MASLTMTASLLGSARQSSVNRRNLVSAKSAARPQEAAVPVARNCGVEEKKESNSRRGVILAAAAAAICAVGSVEGMSAVALEEPKSGTPEAKKKYAPVCVTMPTARICHK